MLLPAVVLGRLLLAQHHKEVEVVPLGVLHLDVVVEAVALGVKGEAVDATYEALVGDLALDHLAVLAQLTERVDDDAEDDVEQDDAHEEPVGESIYNLHSKRGGGGGLGMRGSCDAGTVCLQTRKTCACQA